MACACPDMSRLTSRLKVLLRFLLARQCNVDRAVDMLHSVLKWREQTLFCKIMLSGASLGTVRPR